MKPIKIALLSLMVVGFVCVVMNGTSFSQEEDDYVGQAGCALCHPDEAKLYEGNTHANLPHSCEECHGPGHEHAAAGPDNLRKMKEDKESLLINVITTYEGCGRCHEKNDDLSISMVSNFVIAANQEYPEVMQSRHADQSVAAGMNCTWCHSPHAPVEAEKGMKRKCTTCHAGPRYGMPIAIEGMEDLACEDCHMPMAVTQTEPITDGGYEHGDIRSHIFGISVDPDYAINNNGMAAKNGDGKVRMTVEMTCYACHKTGKSKDMSRDELLMWAKLVHPSE